MTTALLIAGVWCALAVALVAVYGRAAHNRKRCLSTYAARVRYSTEALTEARMRVARRYDANALSAPVSRRAPVTHPTTRRGATRRAQAHTAGARAIAAAIRHPA